MITVVIPGEPVAQGRPRFARADPYVRTYDPARSRSWKAEARAAMVAARAEAEVARTAPGKLAELFASPGALPFPAGPVAVELEAVFSCPRGAERKRAPAQRRPKATKPDLENVAKAVLDAATGVIWTDDAQVAVLSARKDYAAQGEAPYVRLTVWSLDARGTVVGVAHG